LSEVFEKALKMLEEIGAEELRGKIISHSLPELREGDYIVNLFVDSSPPLLGMRSEKLKLELTPASIRHIMRFANIRGLNFHRVGTDVYLLREDAVVAWIRDGMYAASEAKLFEEIGREIYGLGEGRRLRFDKPVSWLDIPRLLRR